MTIFVAYCAGNTRKLIRVYLSLGNYTPLTLSYDYTYGVRVWNAVTGVNKPLERLLVRFGGESVGDCQISVNLYVRIVSFGCAQISIIW